MAASHDLPVQTHHEVLFMTYKTTFDLFGQVLFQGVNVLSLSQHLRTVLKLHLIHTQDKDNI